MLRRACAEFNSELFISPEAVEEVEAHVKRARKLDGDDESPHRPVRVELGQPAHAQLFSRESLSSEDATSFVGGLFVNPRGPRCAWSADLVLDAQGHLRRI